jgi:hypothetical protein
MRTHTHRPKPLARSWLALALLLTATVAEATEAVATELVGGTPPPSRAAESISGARPHALAARPRIGRIFFSPAERARHRDGLAATPMSAASSGNGPPRGERRIVNGALSSGTQGRAVWVNGTAVEDSARDKSAWTDRNGNVWLMNGAQGTHLIKPGQSIDRNGVIEDLLPPGAVARR